MVSNRLDRKNYKRRKLPLALILLTALAMLKSSCLGAHASVKESALDPVTPQEIFAPNAIPR